MRQRVAIARTLILEPRIILMDEPFGALDPPTRTRMQDNLVELWREQSPTVFFITHSIEEAVFLGDHILIFSTSPGTVLKEIRVPPPDRPSIEMQRDPKFLETVFEDPRHHREARVVESSGRLTWRRRAKKAGWIRYLKEAFMFRWNLLVFGGAAAAAAISGPARHRAAAGRRRRGRLPRRADAPAPLPGRDRRQGPRQRPAAKRRARDPDPRAPSARRSSRCSSR